MTPLHSTSTTSATVGSHDNDKSFSLDDVCEDGSCSSLSLNDLSSNSFLEDDDCSYYSDSSFLEDDDSLSASDFGLNDSKLTCNAILCNEPHLNVRKTLCCSTPLCMRHYTQFQIECNYCAATHCLSCNDHRCSLIACKFPQLEIILDNNCTKYATYHCLTCFYNCNTCHQNSHFS